MVFPGVPWLVAASVQTLPCFSHDLYSGCSPPLKKNLLFDLKPILLIQDDLILILLITSAKTFFFFFQMRSHSFQLNIDFGEHYLTH